MLFLIQLSFYANMFVNRYFSKADFSNSNLKLKNFICHAIEICFGIFAAAKSKVIGKLGKLAKETNIFS